jgi:hypothetical protein
MADRRSIKGGPFRRLSLARSAPRVLTRKALADPIARNVHHGKLADACQPEAVGGGFVAQQTPDADCSTSAKFDRLQRFLRRTIAESDVADQIRGWRRNSFGSGLLSCYRWWIKDEPRCEANFRKPLLARGK